MCSAIGECPSNIFLTSGMVSSWIKCPMIGLITKILPFFLSVYFLPHLMCHLPSLQVPNFALGCSDIPLAEGSEITNGSSCLIVQWFTPPHEAIRDPHPHSRVVCQCCSPGKGKQTLPPTFLLDVVYGAGAVKMWGNDDF